MSELFYTFVEIIYLNIKIIIQWEERLNIAKRQS